MRGNFFIESVNGFRQFPGAIIEGESCTVHGEKRIKVIGPVEFAAKHSTVPAERFIECHGPSRMLSDDEWERGVEDVTAPRKMQSLRFTSSEAEFDKWLAFRKQIMELIDSQLEDGNHPDWCDRSGGNVFLISIPRTALRMIDEIMLGLSDGNWLPRRVNELTIEVQGRHIYGQGALRKPVTD
jgi:hypothetical protein